MDLGADRRALAGCGRAGPLKIGDVLIVGDCSGVLHAYDLEADPLDGPPSGALDGRARWVHRVDPGVWRGKAYVGSRGGAVYAIGDRG
jgi:hypothetical protein